VTFGGNDVSETDLVVGEEGGATSEEKKGGGGMYP